MGKENDTVREATAVVLIKEANDLDSMRTKFTLLSGIHSEHAKDAGDDLKKEILRQRQEPVADEEEVRLNEGRKKGLW